jgi:hemolysin D
MTREAPGLRSNPRTERQKKPIRRRSRQPITDLTQLTDPKPGRVHEDRDFLPAALEVIETPLPFSAQLRVYLLCGTLIVALAASFAFSMTTFAIAPGKIVAAGQTKVVEPLETGQISVLHVKDGDIVKQGDVVLELDPTVAIAARTVVVNKLVSARAESARRRAEIAGARTDPLTIDPAVAWDADIPQDVRTRELAVLRADLSQLSATIADLAFRRALKETTEKSLIANIDSEKSLIEATTEKLGMHQKLETKGWDSHARILQALEPLKEQQVALVSLQGDYADAVAAIQVIESRIALERESFVNADVQKLAALGRQIDDLTQQLTKANRTVAAMTLHSPVSGKVSGSVATTVGQVVKPGEQIFQIVPEGAPLEIEAYVLNTDIGFVRVGAPVTVKIDTFPYTRYGTIEGKVTLVASDAISGSEALDQQKNGSVPPVSGALSLTTAAQKTSDLVFPVTVSIAKTGLEVGGRAYSLTAGMSVVAEIETGKQRVIGYIMYPLVRGAPQN